MSSAAILVDDSALRALLSASPVLGTAIENAAGVLRQSTVRVSAGRRAAGAGVVWTTDGRIITNAHVATGASAMVQTADGRELNAQVEYRDTWRDLALLRTNTDDLIPVNVGNERSLRPGQLVFALGHPLGWENALAVGIVHRVDRLDGAGRARWIQADVRLAPGNSGGPLADAEGRVLGINTMVTRGLGLAVPVSAVKRFLVPPRERPRIGVALRPVALRVAGEDGIGLMVVDVEAATPAANARIIPGDILTGAGGVRLAAPYDLGDVLSDSADSHVVRIELIRGGNIIEVEVQMATPPGARAA
jgi:serine protease Do